MKHSIKFMAVSAALVFSNCAYASGSHAGGHDAANIGALGVAANVSRTIEVSMNDAMRFTPSNIRARQGETIRFVIKNTGKLSHESTGELLWQFTQTGTVSFACLHVGHYDAGMKGTVRVTKK